MRNLLIRLSPTILFIVLNMAAIAIIAMFVTQGKLDIYERGTMVFFWVISVPVTAGVSFSDASMVRGLMRDILDLMGIKQ